MRCAALQAATSKGGGAVDDGYGYPESDGSDGFTALNPRTDYLVVA